MLLGRDRFVHHAFSSAADVADEKTFGVFDVFINVLAADRVALLLRYTASDKLAPGRTLDTSAIYFLFFLRISVALTMQDGEVKCLVGVYGWKHDSRLLLFGGFDIFIDIALSSRIRCISFL